MENELPYMVIAAGIVILAVAAAWVEVRIERRLDNPYRKIIERNPRYQTHRRRRR